jgi:hypothetical protein
MRCAGPEIITPEHLGVESFPEVRQQSFPPMPRGKNPRSIANLRPIKKGEVRNPTGINRKRPFSEAYLLTALEVVPEFVRRRLNREAGGELHPKGTTWLEADVRGLHFRAARGEVAAAKELSDRIEGKSPMRLELTSPVKTEAVIEIVYDRKRVKSFTDQE